MSSGDFSACFPELCDLKEHNKVLHCHGRHLERHELRLADSEQHIRELKDHISDCDDRIIRELKPLLKQTALNTKKLVGITAGISGAVTGIIQLLHAMGVLK